MPLPVNVGRYTATRMVLGSDPQQFELSVAEVERGVPGVYAGGDVLVVVRVRLRDFSGAVDAWILREAWSDFLGSYAGSSETGPARRASRA